MKISEKLEKPEIRLLPPKRKKVPHKMTMLPPCQGRSFGEELLPPKGSGVGWRIHHKIHAPPLSGVDFTPLDSVVQNVPSDYSGWNTESTITVC